MAKSFASALKDSKKESKTSAKKSTSPVIDNAPKEVKEAVDAVVNAKAEIKKQGAIQTKNEAVVFDHVKPIQDKDGFNHKHSKSYEISGVKETVKYVTQNRFTVNIDDQENLEELLGEDGFEERFEIQKSLTAVSDIFTDEDLQKEVMEKLGDDLFAKLFVYSEKLKIKADFDKLQYALSKDKLADLRIFAKQYKAAIR
jgi:hypothetical protein